MEDPKLEILLRDSEFEANLGWVRLCLKNAETLSCAVAICSRKSWQGRWQLQGLLVCLCEHFLQFAKF